MASSGTFLEVKSSFYCATALEGRYCYTVVILDGATTVKGDQHLSKRIAYRSYRMQYLLLLLYLLSDSMNEVCLSRLS